MRSVFTSLLVVAAIALGPPVGLGQEAPTQSNEDNPVVGTATGVEVRRQELDQTYRANIRQLATQGIDVEAINRSEAERLFLKQIVFESLLANAATEAQKQTAKAEASALMKASKDAAGSESLFQAELQFLGITEEVATERLERQLRANAVKAARLQSEEEIDEADARAYYTGNPELFEYPASYRAAHILFETIDARTGGPQSASVVEEKRSLAEKVAQMAKSGTPFDQLVREYSDDVRSKERGGAYSFQLGQMDPEFEKAALGLEPNEVAGPVLTRFGYHVVRLIEIKPKRMEDFEKVKDDILERLKQEARQASEPRLMEQVLVEGNFESFLPDSDEVAE